MHIGLYLGSFNPFHIGHLIIGNFVLNNTTVKQIWFIVSPQNPFKKSFLDLLNENKRLNLLKTSTQYNTKFKVSDVEFELPRPSYTFDTLLHLKKKYPNFVFSIIIGSDSFQSIHKWKNGQFLLDNYHFFIYERLGFKINHSSPNINILQAPMLDISSTFIRSEVRQNKPIRYLVKSEVLKEIEQCVFYK